MVLGTQSGRLLIKDGLLQRGCECCVPDQCTVGFIIKAAPFWVNFGYSQARILTGTRGCSDQSSFNIGSGPIQLPRIFNVSFYYQSGDWRVDISVFYLLSFAFYYKVYTSRPLLQDSLGLFVAERLTVSDFTITTSTVPPGLPCYEDFGSAQWNVCDNNFPSLFETYRGGNPLP